MFQTLIEILPGVLLGGFVLGCVYAMIAIGYTMVYGVLQLINFAHSEIFMIGAVAGLEITRALQTHVQQPYLLLLCALLGASATGAFTAMAVERLAYRPLRRRGATNRLVPLITAIGVSFLLQDLVKLTEALWHNEFFLKFPSIDAFNYTIELPYDTQLQVKSIVVVVISLLMALLMYFVVNKTRLGLSIRAVAQDPRAASLMGIDPDKVIAQTFGIGGALGGVAGVLFGLQYSVLSPYVGFIPGVKAFTAAVLGGIGSMPGALVGGLLLGQLETIGGTYLPLLTDGNIGTEYKDIIAFLILIVLLLFRPQGLLGSAAPEKV